MSLTCNITNPIQALLIFIDLHIQQALTSDFPIFFQFFQNDLFLQAN